MQLLSYRENSSPGCPLTQPKPNLLYLFFSSPGPLPRSFSTSTKENVGQDERAGPGLSLAYQAKEKKVRSSGKDTVPNSCLVTNAKEFCVKQHAWRVAFNDIKCCCLLPVPNVILQHGSQTSSGFNPAFLLTQKAHAIISIERELVNPSCWIPLSKAFYFKPLYQTACHMILALLMSLPKPA